MLIPIHRKYFYVSFTGYSKEGLQSRGTATVMVQKNYAPIKELIGMCQESGDFESVFLNCISEINKNQYDEFNS